MANLLLATRESDSLRSENPTMSQPSRGLVLQAGNPLIVGALGHATVLTALSYFRDVMGRGSIAGITVRDPWPYRPNLRALSAQEALLTQFIAKIRVL